LIEKSLKLGEISPFFLAVLRPDQRIFTHCV
jgi:hypothetical protein